MKKILFAIILLCAAFAACKKEKATSNEGTGTLQDVTFKVGFSRDFGEFEPHSISTGNKIKLNTVSSDTSLTNYMTRIYYLVYDTNGILLKNIIQDYSDINFGKYTYKLKQGSYTVAVVGGKAAQIKIYTEEKLSSLKTSGDVYFKKLNIIVGNTSVTENVELRRALSSVLVHINDALPSNTNYAKITVSTCYPYFVINTGAGGGVITTSVNEEYAGPDKFFTGEGFEISTNIFYYKPVSVKITIGHVTKDSNGQIKTLVIYREKSIDNIAGAPTSLITLSGELFTGNASGNNSDFSIAIDSAWNAPINHGF